MFDEFVKFWDWIVTLLMNPWLNFLTSIGFRKKIAEIRNGSFESSDLQSAQDSYFWVHVVSELKNLQVRHNRRMCISTCHSAFGFRFSLRHNTTCIRVTTSCYGGGLQTWSWELLMLILVEIWLFLLLLSLSFGSWYAFVILCFWVILLNIILPSVFQVDFVSGNLS